MSMNEIDQRLDGLFEHLSEIAAEMDLGDDLFTDGLRELNRLWINNEDFGSNFWDIAEDVTEDNFEEFEDLAVACIESVLEEIEA